MKKTWKYYESSNIFYFILRNKRGYLKGENVCHGLVMYVFELNIHSKVKVIVF